MGSYNGGSTIVTARQMGRSDDDWMFTGKSLFGGDGFADAREFHEYCDLMGRMRAYADNYEAAKETPVVRNQIEDMIVSTMVAVARIESGKDERLLGVIRKSQQWPDAFIVDLAAKQSSPALN